MTFETVSLLLNWTELGALLAILFRLGHTFQLIANTQRELRRAIHHLGERRTTEPGTDPTSVGHFSSRALAAREQGSYNDAEGTHKAVGLDDFSWTAHW